MSVSIFVFTFAFASVLELVCGDTLQYRQAGLGEASGALVGLQE